MIVISQIAIPTRSLSTNGKIVKYVSKIIFSFIDVSGAKPFIITALRKFMKLSFLVFPPGSVWIYVVYRHKSPLRASFLTFILPTIFYFKFNFFVLLLF